MGIERGVEAKASNVGVDSDALNLCPFIAPQWLLDLRHGRRRAETGGGGEERRRRMETKRNEGALEI